MTYRVAAWGTGNTGRLALRGIINHPDLELVGLLVHNPEKVGRDAAELCDTEMPPTGVVAISDPDELLALEPDCLAYMGDGIMDPMGSVNHCARFLENGSNVVTCSFNQLVYPKTAPPEMREPIEKACRRGGTTFFANGADPGYASDLFPLMLLSLMDDIESVRVQEISNYKHYQHEHVMRVTFGYGQPVDYEIPLITSGQLIEWWGGMVQLLADQLGVELEAIRQTHDIATLDHDVETSVGTIDAGTIAALRFEIQGIVNGKPVIVIEHSSRMHEDAAPDWPRGTRSDRVYKTIIEGRPRMECEFDMLDEHGKRGLLIATAMRVINAIPFVCDTEPGVLATPDLPFIVGRNLRF